MKPGCLPLAPRPSRVPARGPTVFTCLHVSSQHCLVRRFWTARFVMMVFFSYVTMSFGCTVCFMSPWEISLSNFLCYRMSCLLFQTFARGFGSLIKQFIPIVVSNPRCALWFGCVTMGTPDWLCDTFCVFAITPSMAERRSMKKP